MAKSRDAFRTISEVSEVLDTPAHVLRFWESKFKQIKPVKRAGGRRYYRPDDLALLAAIKDLLHMQGHSIKNAQKMIRDAGVKQVVADGHALLGHDQDSETAKFDIATTAAATPKPVPTATADQSDLFAGQPDAVPAPEPLRVEITGIRAVPDPVVDDADADDDANIFAADETEQEVTAAPAPEVKSAAPIARDLPPPPQKRESMPPRLLAALVSADIAKTKLNAAKIAPLYSRLAALRDELRHPW